MDKKISIPSPPVYRTRLSNLPALLLLTLAQLAGCSISAGAAPLPATSATEPAAPSTAPTSPDHRQTIQLEYTNADDAVRLVNAMFSSGSAMNSGAARAKDTPPSPGILVSSDKATNTVIVTGPKDLVSHAIVLLQSLEQIDQGQGPRMDIGVFFIFHLKDAHAGEMAAVMNRIFSGSPTLPGVAATSPFSHATPDSPRAVVPAPPAPAFFVANPDTNSILVTTNETFEKIVRNILTEFDRRAAPATGQDLP